MMASLVAPVLEAYDSIWKLRDPRVEDFPLMSGPWPTMLICATYVMTVKVWGPNFMKDRPAYQFPRILFVYNLIQVKNQH